LQVTKGLAKAGEKDEAHEEKKTLDWSGGEAGGQGFKRLR